VITKGQYAPGKGTLPPFCSAGNISKYWALAPLKKTVPEILNNLINKMMLTGLPIVICLLEKINDP